MSAIEEQVLASAIEAYAIRCAKANNGGAWATHYTEAQKDYWRGFVRDMVRDCVPIRIGMMREAIRKEMTAHIAKHMTEPRVETGPEHGMVTLSFTTPMRVERTGADETPPWDDPKDA